MAPQNGFNECASDVGILAMEVYFPYLYVSQEELEQFDDVSAGKYTIGLGQKNLGFCTDREDVCSLCLTVVHNLLEKYKIDVKDVGRLEVGTETLIDKSKSVKSVLMQLFSGANNDIEGTDTVNACYGGTAALINAINWVQSCSWDGRYAIVVAGDIAVYGEGPARPTGGAGAVAMLIGPNAPLIFETKTRSSFMKHTYDFYKPKMSSEYPCVNGKYSVECYLTALDNCYQTFKKKMKAVTGQKVFLESFDYVIFHSPFSKLVQKSLARLMFNDYLDCNDDDLKNYDAHLVKFRSYSLEETYFDKDVEKAFMKSSESTFQRTTKASILLAENVGNMYCASVYGALAGLIASYDMEELDGKRVVLFSYGSGLASSMLSLRIKSCSTLKSIKERLDDLKDRLHQRYKIPPAEFANFMKTREQAYGQAPYTPVGPTDQLFPGTYYLESLDEMYRRTYKRIV